jgi:hypothetical protein
MEQVGLNQSRSTTPEFGDQSPETKRIPPTDGLQTDRFHTGLFQHIGQRSSAGQADDERIPKPAIQSQHQLDQGLLSSTGIEVGDAESNGNRSLLRCGHQQSVG